MATNPGNKRPRVLVVAPGHKSRGGIDSVVRLHQSTPLWREMCWMLETYEDRSAWTKVRMALLAYGRAPWMVARTEIVHVHLAGQISLLRKLPIVVLARGMRKKIVIHIHAGSEESLFERTPRWAWRFVLRTADRVVTLSPTWARAIHRRVLEAKVMVMPNPVREFRAAAREGASLRRVLYVGKLEARKGYDNLIDAAAMVLARHPEAEFWFAGNGDVERAQRRAEAIGIAQRVRLLGWVTAEELEGIYEQVGMLCLPSHSEGLPMSVLEAMSHGLPVVCTPVGGLPDVMEDGVHGLFVKPGNAASIANAILRLFESEELAMSLAGAGQAMVLRRFGLKQIEGQLRSLYEELLREECPVVVEVLHGA